MNLSPLTTSLDCDQIDIGNFFYSHYLPLVVRCCFSWHLLSTIFPPPRPFSPPHPPLNLSLPPSHAISLTLLPSQSLSNPPSLPTFPPSLYPPSFSTPLSSLSVRCSHLVPLVSKFFLCERMTRASTSLSSLGTLFGEF